MLFPVVILVVTSAVFVATMTNADMTAPYCKVGPHPLNYTVDMGDPDKAVVCLDIDDTDPSSLCHDNDSSLEYDTFSQDVADFFFLEVTNWQTCLNINRTFNRANFPQKPVMNVTLEAKERDIKSKRKANITFQITFNTPPSTTISKKNYIINMATSGQNSILDIAADFGITDEDKVEFSLAEPNPRLSINATTGSLSVQLVDRDDYPTTVKITDDGIPSLSTEVQVNIEVLSLNCSVQDPVYVNVDDLIFGMQVGRIQCTHSEGYEPTFTYISQTGLELHIWAWAGIIHVVRGNVGNYSVQVDATLDGKLNVDISFIIIIVNETTESTTAVATISVSSSTATRSETPISTLASDVGISKIGPIPSTAKETTESSTTVATTSVLPATAAAPTTRSKTPISTLASEISKNMTAPYCKVGPHPLNYTLDMGDRDKAVVCLDIDDTDPFSLCHDNDSSIEYDIFSQDVADFFCLKVDYTNWQTCLSINKTFNSVNFPQKPVMDVTLEAKERDLLSRKANITFQITFNTPPFTTIDEKNYIINMATSGQNSILDIAADFGITDEDKVEFSLAESHRRLFINATTGGLSVQLVDRDIITATVKITDDGIPSLSTEVHVNIEVLSLNCSVQDPVYVNVDDVGSDRQVGRIQCTHSRGYTPTFTYISQTGLELDISAGSGIISVRTGTVADYSVQVNATLGGKLKVDLSFTLIISEIRTCVFMLLNETWNSSYSDPDAPISVSLRNNVERQIISVVGTIESVASKVVLFREGSVVVYFLLVANNKDKLDAASRLLNSTIETGTLGTFQVGSYQSFRQVGLVQAGRVIYSSSNPNNTIDETRNNTQVTLTCEGLFLLPVGRVTVTWLMTSRNAPVVPLTTSRIQTLTSSPSPGIYQSVLTLNNILYKDTGSFTCKLSDEGGRSDSSSLNIQVIAPPVVSLTPLGQAYISVSDTITLTCNIIEPKTTTTTIHWFKNEAELVENAETGLTSTLSVTGEQQGPTRYHCRAQNVAGMGEESNDITVTLTQGSTCENEDMWPLSVTGFKVQTPCPMGEKGVQTRQCGDNGVWQDVDTSMCVDDDISDVINDIQWISEGVHVNSLEDVAKTLGNSTEPRGLGGAEVALVSASLDRLLTIARESNFSDDQSDTGDFTQGFVTTASNLLDPETSEAWANNDGSPTTVLNLIDSLTEVSADSLTDGEHTTIRSDNIDVLVGKSDPRDIRGIVYPEAIERRNEASFNSFLNLSAAALAKIAVTESLPYSAVYYKNITMQPSQVKSTNSSENVTEEVNSDILSLNLFTASSIHLNPPLTLNFTHTDKSFISEKRVCVYLNIEIDEWESEGCNVTEQGDHYTVCSCDHLTNFAILMNPYTQTVAPAALTLITIIGCSISIFCLVLAVIIYVTVWRYVKSDQAVLIMNICVTLAIAMVVFVVGVDKTSNQDVCTAIAVLLHYFYLVTFFLMLAAGLEIVWRIVQIYATGSKIKLLLVGGWVLPLVVVGLSMAATQMEGYGTPNYCWLSTEGWLIWAFVGPVLFIVIINFVLIGKLLHVFLSTRAMLDKKTAVKVKKALRGICILVPILGVSWVFGILAVNEDVIVFQYIFAILNSLQGLFILITQVLLDRKVRKGLASYKRRFISGRELSEQDRNQAQHNLPLQAVGKSSAFQSTYLLESSTSENQQVSPQGQYYGPGDRPEPVGEEG